MSLLPTDATLRSVVPDLKDSREFVRAVLGNMTREFGNDSQVRLLLDGKRDRPDYVIEMLFDDIIDGGEATPVEVAQAMAIYRGRDHSGRLLEASDYDRPWSHASMKWGEVQSLIGELRGFVPKPPASPRQ